MLFSTERKTLLIHATTWMNFNIMLNGRSQSKKTTRYRSLSHEMSGKGKILEPESRSHYGWEKEVTAVRYPRSSR